MQAAVAIQRGPARRGREPRGPRRPRRCTRRASARCAPSTPSIARCSLSDGGEPEAALSVLQVARDEVGDWPLLAPLEDELLAQEALLRAAVGERELGRALLERAERETATSIPVANALARLRLLEGDPSGRARRARPAPRAADGDRGRATPGVDARRGVAARRAGARRARRARDAAAARWSARSTSPSRPGCSRLIVEHGNRVRPLLHRHVRHGTAHPAIVSEALDTIEQRGSERSRAVAVLLAEPLSEREQAILRYLPTMMSNHEIAGELFVSVNTVKTHLKAIYRKLDASGRREAVQRGRELGLMP